MQPKHWGAAEHSMPPVQEPFAPRAFIDENGQLAQFPDLPRPDVSEEERAQLIALVRKWADDVVAACRVSNAASHLDTENFEQLCDYLQDDRRLENSIYILGLFEGYRDELPLDELPAADRRLLNRIQKLEAVLHNLGMTYRVYREHWQRVTSERTIRIPTEDELRSVEGVIDDPASEAALSAASRRQFKDYVRRVGRYFRRQKGSGARMKSQVVGLFGGLYNMWAMAMTAVAETASGLGTALESERSRMAADPHGRIAVWLTLVAPFLALLKGVLGI
jgi:hypothetical protein